MKATFRIVTEQGLRPEPEEVTAEIDGESEGGWIRGVARVMDDEDWPRTVIGWFRVEDGRLALGYAPRLGEPWNEPYGFGRTGPEAWDMFVKALLVQKDLDGYGGIVSLLYRFGIDQHGQLDDFHDAVKRVTDADPELRDRLLRDLRGVYEKERSWAERTHAALKEIERVLQV